MTTRTVRDWRGIRTQLNRCSSEELINMITNSYATAERIARFRQSLLTELESREVSAAAPGIEIGDAQSDQSALAS